MRRIYKQPIQTILFLFYLFYICLMFILYGYVEGGVDMIKWCGVILVTAEFAYIGAELELRDNNLNYSYSNQEKCNED